MWAAAAVKIAAVRAVVVKGAAVRSSSSEGSSNGEGAAGSCWEQEMHQWGEHH